jgi:hypothetical protein
VLDWAPRRRRGGPDGIHPDRATVFLSDCLTVEPVEGAQVVAGELLHELGTDVAVLSGRRNRTEDGWQPVLSDSVVPFAALRTLRAYHPRLLVWVPNAGLNYRLLVRLLLVHLVLPRAQIRVVLLQRPRSPARWMWWPLRGCVTAVAANRNDVRALSSSGLRTELLEVEAPLDRVSRLSQRCARSHLGVPEDEWVFLHVGHATHGRNLKALEPLADVGRVLLVLSPYSDMDEETLPADPRVRIVHERVEVADYYRAADVYVFPTVDPSSAIGLPMSIVEAIANGVPVVARSSPLTDRWAHHPLVTLVGSDAELAAAAREVAGRRTSA